MRERIPSRLQSTNEYFLKAWSSRARVVILAECSGCVGTAARCPTRSHRYRRGPSYYVCGRELAIYAHDHTESLLFIWMTRFVAGLCNDSLDPLQVSLRRTASDQGSMMPSARDAPAGPHQERVSGDTPRPRIARVGDECRARFRHHRPLRSDLPRARRGGTLRCV